MDTHELRTLGDDAIRTLAKKLGRDAPPAPPAGFVVDMVAVWGSESSSYVATAMDRGDIVQAVNAVLQATRATDVATYRSQFGLRNVFVVNGSDEEPYDFEADESARLAAWHAGRIHEHMELGGRQLWLRTCVPGLLAVPSPAGDQPDVGLCEPPGTKPHALMYVATTTHIAALYVDAEARVATLIDSGFHPLNAETIAHLSVPTDIVKATLQWRFQQYIDHVHGDGSNAQYGMTCTAAATFALGVLAATPGPTMRATATRLCALYNSPSISHDDFDETVTVFVWRLLQLVMPAKYPSTAMLPAAAGPRAARIHFVYTGTIRVTEAQISAFLGLRLSFMDIYEEEPAVGSIDLTFAVEPSCTWADFVPRVAALLRTPATHLVFSTADGPLDHVPADASVVHILADAATRGVLDVAVHEVVPE